MSTAAKKDSSTPTMSSPASPMLMIYASMTRGKIVDQTLTASVWHVPPQRDRPKSQPPDGGTLFQSHRCQQRHRLIHTAEVTPANLPSVTAGQLRLRPSADDPLLTCSLAANISAPFCGELSETQLPPKKPRRTVVLLPQGHARTVETDYSSIKRETTWKA